jgi:opacity protein-like surface antigen
MKKPILAMLAIAALIPATAAAQARRTARVPTGVWNAGILGGATFSNLSTSNNTPLKTAIGAQAGVFADYGINRNVGARIEVLISQRGAKNDATDNTMRLAYLDVPVFVRIGPTTTNETHFHAFTGLTPGFLLKKDTTTGGVLTGDINSANLKSFDLGWLIGAGVEQHAWSLDARYTLGLLNINDVPSAVTIKNRSFSINVGYRF